MLKWFVPTLNHLHINVVDVLVGILLNALLPLAVSVLYIMHVNKTHYHFNDS
jgi:hypothetical protein